MSNSFSLEKIEKYFIKRKTPKICTILIAFIILIMVTGCSGEKQRAVQSKQPLANASEEPMQTTQKETQSSEGDIGDDTPLEWPMELMGDVLPVPSGTITSIDKANQIWSDDTPAQIIVVSFKNMSMDDCIMYVNKLKKLEFAGGVSEQTNKKISFSGVINDVGIGVSFSYDFIENKGFVSYNPSINENEIEKWPSEKMGNVPDPNCKLISLREDGEGENKLSIIDFANMNEQAAKEYVLKLKELGYAAETDMSDNEKILFKGYDKDGNGVNFDYSVIYENGVISFGNKQALTGC